MHGTHVSVVNKDKHLVKYLSTDINDRNTISNVCDLISKKQYSVIRDFSICDSETLNKIHSTFCMHMCGCELWNITDSDEDKILCCLAESKMSSKFQHFTFFLATTGLLVLVH